MSYDRVLPKPPALHYDSPQASLSRPTTSNLLEHKIMNDGITMSDHRMDKTPSYRYSESLPQVNLLSLHRSRVGMDKNPTSPSASSTLEASKPAPGLPTKSLPMRDQSSISERSSSSSPVKSAAPGPRESVTQFCLCQPDPKIPRPRNGKPIQSLIETIVLHAAANLRLPTAFILYRQHYQGAVVAQNPGLANPDISKIIGEQWRKLPQATKDEWKALAEVNKPHEEAHFLLLSF